MDKRLKQQTKKYIIFSLRRLEKKVEARITTIDFISIRGQRNFEDDAEINPIEIKIENDKIQNIFEKYKKNPVKFTLEGLLFSSAIKNETKKNICNHKRINRCKIQPRKRKTISNNWRN